MGGQRGLAASRRAREVWGERVSGARQEGVRRDSAMPDFGGRDS